MNSGLNTVIFWAVLTSSMFPAACADLHADKSITTTATAPPPSSIVIARTATSAPPDTDTKTTTTHEQPTESGENLRVQAVGYFYAGDKVKALAIMDRAIKQSPEDAANYHVRGTFYAQMQNFPPAIADLRQSTVLDPSAVDAWTNLGGSLLFNGDFAAAQVASAKAVELLPSYMATANLGHTYFLQGDRKTARLWYAKSMQLLPNEDALRTGPLADFAWFIAHNWHPDLSRSEQAWYAQEAKTVLSHSTQAEAAKIALVVQRAAQAEAQFVKQSTARVSELNAELSDIQSLERSLGRNHPQITRRYQILSERFKYQAEGYNLSRYYTEAEPLYKQALTIGILAFGNDSIEVADILHRMGASYVTQKRYTEAGNFLARALAIKEKTIGRYHEDLFVDLMDLYECYMEQERFNEAELLLKQVITIGERSKHNKLHSTGWLGLALIYQKQGRYVEADNAKLRADALKESTKVDARNQAGTVALQSFTAPVITNPAPRVSPSAPTTPNTVPDTKQHADASAEADQQMLHQMDQTLWMTGSVLLEQNNPVEADKVLQRWLHIKAALYGPNHPFFVDAISTVADSYAEKFLYSYAEPVYQRALMVSTKILGNQHPDHIKLLRKIAGFYDSAGQYTKAETLYKQILTIRQQIGANTLTVAESFDDLCSFYKNQNRYYDAEQLCRQALITREHLLQPDHADIGDNIRQLANIYGDVGRYTEAEALYQRAQKIGHNLIAMFPQIGIAPNSASTGIGYGVKSQGFSLVARANLGLAAIYQQQQRYAEAEQLIKEAQSKYEQLFGAKHIVTYGLLGKLAALYAEQKRYSDAEPLAKASLTATQQTFGARHPYILGQLTLLAKLYREQGRYAEAEVLYKQAMGIVSEIYGTTNIHNVRIFQGLASLYHKQGKISLALGHIRRASDILRRYLTITNNDRLASMDDKHITYKDALLLHLAILNAKQHEALTAQDTTEGFAIGQIYHDNDVGSALAEMAARTATGDGTLANLARQQQDTLHAYQKTDKNLIDLLSKPPAKRNLVNEQNLRIQLAELKAALDALNAQLAKQFPDYMDLLNPKPSTIAEVQQLLTPGEALVAYALGKEQSFVWLITPDSASFRQLAKTKTDIETQVQTLRASLDPALNEELTAAFPVTTAHALYQDLLGPESARLATVKTLFVVADGPLESLPFAVLVTDAPTGDPQDYQKIAWLSRKLATATLPTVSSLRALRNLPQQRPTAIKPFIGFGDPNLRGNANCIAQRGGEVLATGTTNTGLVDPNAIHEWLCPLPETADELRAVARILSSGTASVYLRDQATVSKVNSTPLVDYRVVDFATHALVAGELKEYTLGQVEPAIVLTPPTIATVDNDGLLRASQVAQLKLNADWVVLSACNTASSDGTLGAVGLSGLAKAFFYAGARAMLVSHWSVASQPAVALTTGMFRIWQNHPELGRAEALRQAEMAVLDHPADTYFTHPGAWAPFVVAGEGGSQLSP